jgi:hypothetical protein
MIPFAIPSATAIVVAKSELPKVLAKLDDIEVDGPSDVLLSDGSDLPSAGSAPGSDPPVSMSTLAEETFGGGVARLPCGVKRKALDIRFITVTAEITA